MRAPSALLLSLLMLLPARGAAAQDPPVPCAGSGAGRPVVAVLPGATLFPAPIAGSGEPRIALAYTRIDLPGGPELSGGERRAFNAGVVSAGGVFPLVERRDACRALQVALLGGVFSQFNLDAPSAELVNSDFVVGFEAAYRQGAVSARLRVYHQSSHLGDEFLLRNPEIQRLDFGFQAVDGLLSIDHGSWRAYGGAGARLFSHRPLPPAALRAGLEARRGAHSGARPRLVAALDISANQATGWDPLSAAAAGLEWMGAASGRRLRTLLVAFAGPAPYGQFDRQEIRHLGVQTQFEF